MFIQFLATVLIFQLILTNGYKPLPSNYVFHDQSSHHGYTRNSIKFCTSNTPTALKQEWYSSKVVTNAKGGEGLRLITIQVSADIAQSYVNPGQYMKLKIGDSKPSFYAIANPPDQRDIFTFLVKESPSNEFLLSSDSGASIDASLAQGKGYQIDEYFNNYKSDFPTTNVLLMATGSGLAPIAAAIESNKLALKQTGFNSLFPRQATLYIGARTQQHLPFADKYGDWESLGVKIIPVLSKPENWDGRTGYIQDALKQDRVPAPKNCGALLCGMRGMTDAAKEILLDAGVFEGRILFNF